MVVALAGLYVFAPVIAPSNALFFRDHTTVFRRLFALIREAYRRGELPLWDPLIGGGEPLAAYPAAVAFSPLHLLTVWLPESLDPYDLFVVAELLLGAAGAYALARVLGLSARGRLCALVIFGLGGPLLSMNNIVPALHSAAFGPWSLAAALEVWRCPSAPRVAALALALSVHVQGADPAFLFCDAAAFLGCVPWVKSERPLPARALALALGALLGAGAAMIQIVPLLELLRGTPRAAGYVGSADWSTHPGHLLELSMPGIAGDFLEVRTLFSTDGGRHYLASLYLSAIAIPSVAVAVTLRRAWSVLLALVVCALVSVGDATPLLAAVKALVPGMASSRFPVKYMYGVALLAPILVPTALEALEAWSERSIAALFLGWIVLVSGVGAIPAEWWLAHVPSAGLGPGEVEALFAGAASHAALASGAVALALLASRRWAAWSWGAPALLAVDLAFAATPLLPTMDPLPSRSPLAELVTREGVDHPTVFRYEAPTAPLDLRSDTLRGYLSLEPMGASPFGVRHMLDIDLNDVRPPAWTKVVDFVQATLDERGKLRLLGRLGTTHLLVSTSKRQLPGLRYLDTVEVPGSAPISAFALEGARPYLSFATSVRVVPDLDAAILAMSSSVAPAGEVCATEALASDGAARITARAGLELEVVAEADALLVVAQRYDAGWRATIDGVEARTVPVDAMLLGVPVPRGEHRVRLDYAPRSVTLGARLSLASLALIAALALVRGRRAP